jgi:hypothetical protein
MKRYGYIILLLSSIQPLFSDVIGEVIKVGGVVKLYGEIRKIEKRVISGDEIFDSDTVKVGRDSFVKVNLKDKTVITIGENSSFDFKKYRILEENRKKRLKFFGSLTSTIKLFADGRFKVKKEDSILGSRMADLPKELSDGKRCKVALPIYGELIKEEFDERIYKSEKSLDELLELYTIKIPDNILILTITLLPEEKGYSIDAEEFVNSGGKVRLKQEYKIEILRGDEFNTIKIWCREV